MSSKRDFISYLQQYEIELDEFMDMYSEFAELDKDTRLDIIQNYSDKISNIRKKGEDY